jgi:hypothetical protein
MSRVTIHELLDLYTDLQRKWNDLVERVNEKGGEAFLERGVLPDDAPPQFTPEEIRNLIFLCHPDRHNGKAIAVQMTQKLLKLRT